jgi:DNA-binding NarL/FixJ family response regulator
LRLHDRHGRIRPPERVFTGHGEGIDPAWGRVDLLPTTMDTKTRTEHAGRSGKVLTARRGPYRAARNDPLGLTSRERCVLVLLQQGLSNRAIARRLCRSERTIEHHVSSLFAKLGIASRSELETPERNLGTANASTQRLDSIPFRK